jgi:hypothetical protein
MKCDGSKVMEETTASTVSIEAECWLANFYQPEGH